MKPQYEPTTDKEMQRALEADGEKLRQMTGQDHGPRKLTPEEAELIWRALMDSHR